MGIDFLSQIWLLLLLGVLHKERAKGLKIWAKVIAFLFQNFPKIQLKKGLKSGCDAKVPYAAISFLTSCLSHKKLNIIELSYNYCSL